MADIYRRCGCRDDAGRQYGTTCPKLATDPKHGTWAFYLAAGIDPKTGRRRQVRRAGFATKQAAQKARNAAASKVDSGTYVAPTKQTYAEYLDKWFQRRQTTGRGLKPTTADNYARYIRDDIQPSSLGRMKLTDIRRFHINDFVSDLTEAGRGATTVRRIAAVVQGSLKAAWHDDLIDHNPGVGIKLPVVPKKKFQPWQPEQVGTFLDAASQHRLGALFELAILTGLRRGEAIGLRWDDVDLTRRTITVRNNRTQAGRTIVEGTAKTDAGDNRVLSMSDAVVGALVAWKLRQQEEAEAFKEVWTDTGYVFTYEDGQPLKPQYATRLFDKIRASAGLPRMTFHGQRHENASLLLSGGADIAVVSKMLGHSSVSVTADIYSHLIGSAALDASERAAAMIPRKSGDAHTLHTQPELKA
ncbi:site-specific integrase [Leifsonia sp. Leaf336]|uniref:site-specific integrase n=1 Tax=Leifsonia sp. Leaf336 TaxID=1736341 RepID=UPI0009E7FB84|nr:site-specific integrase [Leifsonia sp. Leaf336]